ncbi:hypothetical protein Hypma_016136 [Hypsizygus marmoreus]|uniref:Uncharacterized protein n=1 Tax=Hypsizygus marmoreus TaxID=39966 RepID=A0A369J2Y9_HYPMA|nr:hypothetical protein Hypma_016136 [Hypsizygus marmoreus]
MHQILAVTADHMVTGPSFTSPAKPSPAKPSPSKPSSVRSLGKAQCIQGPSLPVKNETNNEEDNVLPDLGHLSINDAFAHATRNPFEGNQIQANLHRKGRERRRGTSCSMGGEREFSGPGHRGPSLTELSAKKSMSSEECFWSVVRRDHPGVYKGETAARAAIGSHPCPAVYKNTAGQASASILFTCKYMEGEVDRH